MPHLNIEYSKNLENKIYARELLKKLHASLEQCVGLDLNRVKSRTIEHDLVLGSKTATEIQMIHVTLSILSGRDAETKKIYGQTLFESLKSAVPESLRNSTSLTVEVREMDRDCYFKN